MMPASYRDFMDIDHETMRTITVTSYINETWYCEYTNTPTTDNPTFPTLRALMEASRPEMSPLGGAGRSHVMAAQHAGAQHSVRRSSGRLNQVASRIVVCAVCHVCARRMGGVPA